jgi:DNA-binding SARP family transcriptional activator
MLKLDLFGVGQARYYDHPLVNFPNWQCHHLLCYLILNRQHAHHRDRLAAVFWGEYPQTASRKYLRNALWRLRNALQSAGAPVNKYLSITEDSVSFSASGPCSLDIEDFEMTITQYQDIEGQHLTPEQAANLEEAVDLYAGDLLEGVYEDWCLYDRERLRILYLNTLSKLLAFHELNGTYERGLGYGKQILALDPTREKVHRQVMRLYWHLGDQNEALAQYKYCVQVLREELGTPPMERTNLLYQQMVSNQFNPAGWSVHCHHSLPGGFEQDESIQSVVGYTLERLHRLQAMTEEASAELSQIERLINKTLSNLKRV